MASFDRVNHDKLVSELFKRMKDTRVLTLIRSYLNSGAILDGLFIETEEGTPQGSPLSPLLSNIMLDLLDKELERRGHSFVRYADDCNIYVRTQKAGERVMGSIAGFITKKLKLKVNREKSAVDKAHKRKFLGFMLRYVKGNVKIGISPESFARVKNRIRAITSRNQGNSMDVVLAHLRRYLGGWKGYYGHIETPSKLEELDGWIRHRLRCYQLHLWGQGSGTYRAFKQLGVSHKESWMVAWSSRGFWRTSTNKIVQQTLNNKFLEKRGFVPLFQKQDRLP